MTRLHTMHDRYENDVQFRTVVDVLQHAIERLEMTPSEVRECAMYACMRVEMRKPIELRISREDWERFMAEHRPPSELDR